jgi:hypothetical protein
MHLDNEKHQEERDKKWDERLGKMDERIGKMLDIVERLDTIIRIYEARHNGHDDRLDNLERR